MKHSQKVETHLTKTQTRYHSQQAISFKTTPLPRTSIKDQMVVFKVVLTTYLLKVAECLHGMESQSTLQEVSTTLMS